MSQHNRKLIIITNNYPFGSGEEFLASEIKYIKNSFDKLIILSKNSIDQQTKVVPDDIKVYRLERRKTLLGVFKLLEDLFKVFLWRELKNIKRLYNLKLTFSIIMKLVRFNYLGNTIKKKLERIVKENNIDTGNLYIYSYWATYLAVAAAKYKKGNPEIVAFTRIHSYDLYFERNSDKYIPFRVFIYNNLDAIFFISKNGKEYFKNKIKLPNDKKTYVSRLGVENDIYDFKDSVRSNPLKLVSCSFLSPVKRINLLIEALAEINNFKLEWTHIGSGPEYHSIVELAKDLLEQKSNIDFEFKGYLDRQQIFSCYKENEFDCFINVSSYEGIPVSIMEAFSFGIPAIAPDVGAVSEIVSDKNGILLASQPDIRDIIKAIKKIKYMDEQMYLEKQKSAYRTWQENYNAEKNYTTFLDFVGDFYS